MAMSPRLLRPRASGFNPKSIAGLEAWYAADVASSITIATGVQQWSDLSGKGRHLIQDTTNNQPAYNIVTVNGKPTVTFDGTNDRLGTTATFSVALPVSMFLVYRFEGAYVSGAPRVFSHGVPTLRQAEFFRNDVNDTRPYLGSGGVSNQTARVRLRKNQVVFNYQTEPRVATPDADVQAFNIWDFEFGETGGNPVARIELAHLQNSSFGNISVAEYLLFSRWLPVTEADKVRRYFAQKYNLTFQA